MNDSKNISHRSFQSRLSPWFAIVIAVMSLPLAAQARFTAALAGTTATFTGDAASDTIVITTSGGLLVHNRFSAGDPGFNSNIDFNSAVAGDQTLAASSASTVNINCGAGNDVIILLGNDGTLNNLRYLPTAFGAGTVIDDSDGTLPTFNFTGAERLELQVQPADADSVRLDGTTGNDDIHFYPDLSVGTGTAVGFMDQNNATGFGPFTMTPMVYSGQFPVGNDLDVNFFNPGGTDTITYHGDDRNEQIDVLGGEAGGIEVRDTISGVVHQRLEIFNVASVTVLGGGGINTFSHQAFLTTPISYFGSGSASDSLTYFGTSNAPLVVDLPGKITENGTRVINFTGIGLVNIAASGAITTLMVNGTAGNDALSFAPTSATAGAFSNNAQAPLFSYTNLAGGVTVNGGAGTDSLAILGTEAADTVTVNAPTVTLLKAITLANLEQLSISTFGGDDTITVSAAPMSLSINSGEGSDTFTITPSANFPMTLVGGNPAPPTAPGDALNVNTGGTTNPTVTATLGPEGYQGSYTFGNRQPVIFQQMETLNPAVPAPPAAPSSVQFAQGQYQVGEADGLAVVVVTRSGNTTTAVTVDFATSNDTATAGSDYTTTNGTLNFAAGETSKSISVPITDDPTDENSETFRVTLSNPTGGAVLSSPFQAAVVIIDNDGPPPAPTPASVQFAQGQNQVGEGDGLAVVVVTRSGNTTTAVTVDFATSNDTATAGSDYTATNGTLSFAANETSKSISVPITDDTADENSETFRITLSNPTGGAVLGTPFQTGVVIVDNDPSPVPTPGNFANIATRVRVQTGENVLIGGLIVTGNTPEKVVVRALGPSLGAAGVPGTLADPLLELYNQGGSLIATNDDWKVSNPNMAEIKAAGLGPSNDKESALLAVLPAGGYTVIVRGVGGTSGVGMVEGYDLNQAVDTRFGNISTRGFVQTGDNIMIGGFIIRPGAVNNNVALRGLGPSLAQSGVSQTLADPTLDLRNSSGTPVSFSDDWMENPAQAVQLTSHGLAPQDPKESGIFASLAPGAYTVILRGKNSTTGVGLVEMYDVRD